MNDINSFELKQIRDTKITFRTYSSIADQLEKIYGNKHRAAQLIFDNFLSIRNLIIKEIAEKLTKDELCFLVETFHVISSPNGFFQEFFLYSEIMGFLEIVKKMEDYGIDLFSSKEEVSKVDMKLLKPKLDTLTPVQIFFLEDLCKTYRVEIDFKDYVDSILI